MAPMSGAASPLSSSVVVVVSRSLFTTASRIGAEVPSCGDRGRHERQQTEREEAVG